VDSMRAPLEDAGFAVAYKQVSFCSGVFLLHGRAGR
jgi:hypothetical protein